VIPVDDFALRRAMKGVLVMTELVVKLPDELAQRARRAGLLSDGAIQRLLEDAMRREAGRQLLDAAARIRAAGVAPMSDEQVVAEVKAARAERRARQDKPQDAQ
jgi:post-segregation antitoxin (ccd killing protein)